MPEVTIEILQQYMIENGCKVKSSDAIEFFRNNFVDKLDDVSQNKDLFKKYMEELTTAQLSDSGERYLVLKRQHMVYVSTPRCTHTPRIGSRTNNSPRIRRTITPSKSVNTSPRSPRTSNPSEISSSKSLPNPSGLDSNKLQTPTVGGCLNEDLEDGLRSPVSGYESDEFSDPDFDNMELGSIGGYSNNPLEPNQKEWIYKTAVGDLDSVTRLLLQDTGKSLVKYKDFISGYTGLHWACKLGRVDMVHVLLASDSDVNAKAFNGMTPLHIAVQCGHDNIINILIDNKADKYVRDYNGRYPVYYMPSRCSPTVREVITPPVVNSQKPRSSKGTPISRRPSLSSLDDARKYDRKETKSHPKQYMSGTINLLRSSFRLKRESPQENRSPPGSLESLSASTLFVRPRLPKSTKSGISSKLPPSLSKIQNHLRASMLKKRVFSKNKPGYV